MGRSGVSMFSADDLHGAIAQADPLRGQSAHASVGASDEDIGNASVGDCDSTWRVPS
jgi:hypothetical protein